MKTLVLTALTGAASLALTSVAPASVVTDFNLVVTGNLTAGHDVEGRAYVGGNITGNAATFAQQLNSTNFAGIDTLLVGGNISISNTNLLAGNLRITGTRSGSFNPASGVQITDGAALAMLPAVQTELSTFSALLHNLTPNSTAALPGPQPGPVTFNASPVNGLAVFNVLGSSIFSNGLAQSIGLNSGGASAIVINVAGTTINFNQGNFVGGWINANIHANTIWNFYEATSITLDRNFHGAILAPLATLTNTTAIEGSVFVKNLNQQGEVHLPLYTGFIPTPGAAALLSLAGLAATRRRR